MSEGIYPVEDIKANWGKKPSNWHRGKPTENGWYLLACKIGNSSEYFYAVDHWNNDIKQWSINRVVAWQKIEPYKQD